MKKRKLKAKYKIIMVDGYTQKVSSFVDDIESDDIAAVRSWMNETCPFINVGNNVILNLRYIKRIKRIWRLRDHLPKFLKMNFRRALISFILWLIIIGYLIIVIVAFTQ